MDIKKDYDFYGYHTSNSFKIDIILKELGIDSYNYIEVDIAANEQFKPEFLKLNPNNKIPVLVDNTVSPPLVLFESATILEYLADKHSKLLPGLDVPHKRYEVLKWLTFTVASQGPNMGQLLFWKIHNPEKIQLAIDRAQNEIERIYGVLEGVLKEREYIGGSELSICDISCYGWAMYLKFEGICIINDWESKYPNLVRWFNLVEKRPSFQYSIKVADDGIKKWKAKQLQHLQQQQQQQQQQQPQQQQ